MARIKPQFKEVFTSCKTTEGTQPLLTNIVKCNHPWAALVPRKYMLLRRNAGFKADGKSILKKKLDSWTKQ